MAVSVLCFSLPQGAVGWSAVYDCCISWSYSLTNGIYLCKISISLTSGSEDVVYLVPFAILLCEVGTICACFAEGIEGNIYVELFYIWYRWKCCLKTFIGVLD